MATSADEEIQVQQRVEPELGIVDGDGHLYLPCLSIEPPLLLQLPPE